MSDEELIARLREIQGQAGLFASAAADRIEALVKERNIAQHQARMRKAFIEEARDERDRAEAERDAANALLRELLADCQYEYPPSHGAIAYAIRAHLGAKP